MKNTKSQSFPLSALLFVFAAPFTVIFYASYVFNPLHAGNMYLYSFQLIADFISIVIVSSLWLTIILDILQPHHHRRDMQFDNDWVKEYQPTVDILMPVASEPISIIEQTLKSVIKIEYPHSVYLLDDSHTQQIQKLAFDYHVHYVSRPKHNKTFAKSGNLNYGLTQSKADFFVVFDADHVPEKTFLTELLPYFVNDKVALVQTPQHFTNTNSFIASGTTQAQEIFYNYIQPAKNSYNAAFCVGTNVIYRRSAIDSIGGIPLKNHSEDIWTSLLLHEKGFETVFYNKVLARGKAPETITAFFRQQHRWSRGGFTLFFTYNPLFSKTLHLDQKLQYFFSNLHYFSVFAILAYMILPIIYLFTGMFPMNILNSKGWLMHYVPYFLTIYFLPIFLIGRLRIATISTSIASFYPYLQSFFSVLFRRKFHWVATEAKTTKLNLVMSNIWPHVLIIVLSFVGVFIGWYHVQDPTTTAVISFWTLLNAYFLFLFIVRGIFI